MAKRPSKQATINFLMSQYSFLSMGMEGINMRVVGRMIKTGSYYLFEAEIKALIEAEVEKDPNFDAELFVNMLKEGDAIRQGATPRLTDNLVRVNSKERALEVVNDPSNEKDVQTVVDVMTKIKELADSLKPIIDKKATVSVALKNKKASKKKDTSEDSEDSE